MNEVNWIPFENRLFPNYQKFAWKYYGEKAYQAKHSYIQWLYKENPLSKKNEDFLVGIPKDEKTIVGCIHKMRMLWNYKKDVINISSLHNLMVDEEYRYGTGFMLVMAAITNEEHALMPGVVQPFTEFYKALGYEKVSVLWYRKLLKPFRGILFSSTNKFLNYPAKESYFDQSKLKKLNSKNCRITMSPNDSILEQLTHSMNTHDSEVSSPCWNVEQLRWVCEYYNGTDDFPKGGTSIPPRLS